MSDDRGTGGDYGGGGNGGDYGGGGDSTPQPAGGGGNQEPLLYGNWTPALFMPYRRSIGGIIANVTIEENATDDLTITEHPVEQGAPIADHAFKRPTTVTIRAGWSVARAYDLSAESGIYGLLLSWQASLTPFDVVTGKRRYTNMLMERLTVITDQHSEYVLMADIVCRQVIIVSTQTTKVDSASENSENHTDSENTSPEKSKGDEATKPTGDGGVLLAPTDTRNLDPQVLPPSATLSRPPEGGDDTGFAARSGASPEARNLEVTAASNTSVIGRGEKGLARVTEGSQQLGATVSPFSVAQSRSVGLSWRKTLKYRPNPTARSVSASQSWGSPTR